jgi:hypothetical protein
MVEDAQLHPFFAHCVWLMAAHAKGFPVQESHVQLLQVRPFDAPRIRVAFPRDRARAALS